LVLQTSLRSGRKGNKAKKIGQNNLYSNIIGYFYPRTILSNDDVLAISILSTTE
jgi:hypothetical protein